MGRKATIREEINHAIHLLQQVEEPTVFHTQAINTFETILDDYILVKKKDLNTIVQEKLEIDKEFNTYTYSMNMELQKKLMTDFIDGLIEEEYLDLTTHIRKEAHHKFINALEDPEKSLEK